MTDSNRELGLSQDTHAEVALLAQRLDTLNAASVSRQEFEELKRLVNNLAARVELIAPPDQISDEHLAIMCAVFAATVGKRFKIKHVQHVQEPSGWTQAGRVNLHAQRHVRRS